MDDKGKKQSQEKKKGFVARIIDKIDKNLETKSRSRGCCCCPDDSSKGSCS